jgi:hypothetical protein
MQTATIEVRFWRHVTFEPNTGCWLWVSSWRRDGYGHIDFRSAHRLSYEMHKGPISKGLEIDHLCRTPCCVNPCHLETVTHAVNVRRSFESRGIPTDPELRRARHRERKRKNAARRRAELREKRANSGEVRIRPPAPYQHIPGKPDRREYWRSYRALHKDRIRERERQYIAHRKAEVAASDLKEVAQ